MILSRGRHYIFIHIPKTGGTALSLALEARAMKDDVLVGDTPKARARAGRQKGLTTAGRLWKHSTLAEIDGLVASEELDDFFIFTLVRNPWDRMVSYYHWLKGQGFNHQAVALARSLDFSDFLRHPLMQDSFRRWPAAAYLQGADGQYHASLCARLEHLDEDLVPLEDHLGFRLTPLARVNQSERPRDYRTCYSDSDAVLLAELCADDIARFGYGFDG